MIQTKKLTIKKSNFQELKKRFQWKGSGTEVDPVEITSTKDLPNMLKFKTKDLHIKISNIQHYSIKLIFCRNITIYNCRISILELKSCWNLTVKSNDIKDIQLVCCKGNIFEHNKISNIESLTKHNPKKIYARFSRSASGIVVYSISPLLYIFPIIMYINLVSCFGPYKWTLARLFVLIILNIIFDPPSVYILWWVMIKPLKMFNRLRKLEPNKLNGNSTRVKDSGLEFPNLIEKRNDVWIQ